MRISDGSSDVCSSDPAFGLMLVLNGGLALAQLFLAGIAADYYGQPMVANLLRVQALIYLSTPFISLPEVLIGRRLNFKAPAFVNILTAMVTAVVSLTGALRSEEHTSELQSLMRLSYAVFCLKKKHKLTSI